MSVRILQGSALDVLRTLPAESVQCVVTSPPYYALRDYGVDGQIGLEQTPQAFLEALWAVFDEVRRVLRPDGLCFVNIGDSYSGSGKGGYSSTGIVGDHTVRQGFDGDVRYRSSTLAEGRVAKNDGYKLGDRVKPDVSKCPEGIPAKNLLLIPQRFAIGMQERGWWVRSEIVWAKTSAMPESVRDRPTSAWEPIWMFAKSQRYFWDADAVRQPSVSPQQEAHNQKYARVYDFGLSTPGNGQPNNTNHTGIHSRPGPGGANIRNVWTIGPEPNREVTPATKRVPVALDEVDDDTERTTSPDCPVHGDRPASTSRCGGPLGDSLNRNPRNGTGRVPAPPVEGVPIAGQSSVALETESSGDHAATPHSTPSSRTDLHAATTPACTASAQSLPRTGDTSGARGLFDPDGDTPESSTSAPASLAPDGSQTTSRTGGTAPSAGRTDSTGLRDAVHIDGSNTSGDSASSERRSGPSARTAASSTDKSTCTCSYSRVIIRESSHFASYPTEIPKRCILAGTSEKGCCPSCGAPWVRVVERGNSKHHCRPGCGHQSLDFRDGWDGGSYGGFSNTARATDTWQPGCACDAGPPIPCAVLDPFLGSGTTALVADRLGRDAIGIELNPEYAEMARRRIANDAGFLAEVAVEQPAHAAPSLFDALEAS